MANTQHETADRRLAATTGSVSLHRCSTLLCGGHGAWRRPKSWGGYSEGWVNKCQTCFDRNVGESERAQWSRIISPNVAGEATASTKL